jgi:hypothetical protein
MYNIRYSCRILIKVKFSWQIFGKHTYQICCSTRTQKHTDRRTDGQTDRQETDIQADVQTDEQADRHDEANNRF